MPTFVNIIKSKKNDLAELELFADVCMKSLRQAVKAVEGVELQQKIASLLGEPSPFSSQDELTRAKERAEKVADFASSQRANGDPYLFSLCAVRLWALMEALVDELVVEAMHSPQEACDHALLGKLKGPLVEFLSAPKEEQAEFLAETLKQSVDAPLKLGIGRFEAMLEPVGLGGKVNDDVRKALFELSQIRNNIVHKSGKADRRLVEACPWLRFARNTPVHVTMEMFKRYLIAAYWYIVEIRGRVDERCGQNRSDEVKQALSLLEPLLTFAPKRISTSIEPEESQNEVFTSGDSPQD
jgi:hypothetical protein